MGAPTRLPPHHRPRPRRMGPRHERPLAKRPNLTHEMAHRAAHTSQVRTPQRRRTAMKAQRALLQKGFLRNAAELPANWQPRQTRPTPRPQKWRPTMRANQRIKNRLRLRSMPDGTIWGEVAPHKRTLVHWGWNSPTQQNTTIPRLCERGGDGCGCDGCGCGCGGAGGGGCDCGGAGGGGCGCEEGGCACGCTCSGTGSCAPGGGGCACGTGPGGSGGPCAGGGGGAPEGPPQGGAPGGTDFGGADFGGLDVGAPSGGFAGGGFAGGFGGLDFGGYSSSDFGAYAAAGPSGYGSFDVGPGISGYGPSFGTYDPAGFSSMSSLDPGFQGFEDPADKDVVSPSAPAALASAANYGSIVGPAETSVELGTSIAGQTAFGLAQAVANQPSFNAVAFLQAAIANPSLISTPAPQDIPAPSPPGQGIFGIPRSAEDIFGIGTVQAFEAG